VTSKCGNAHSRYLAELGASRDECWGGAGRASVDRILAGRIRRSRLPAMTRTGTQRTRSSRRARCRRSCAPEKRCTGIFGARTGHRSYNPDSGRWLNRDPIKDRGRADVYTFNYNSSVSWIDPDGMAPHWNWNQGGGGGSGNGNSTTTTAVVTVLIGFCANGRCIPAAQTAVRTVVAVRVTVTAGRGLATPIGAFVGLLAGGEAVVWVANQVGPPAVIYPNSQIHGQNAVPCTVSALGSIGHTGVPNTPRCRQILDDCQDECVDALPTNDSGFAYDRCVNQCLFDNDCGGINYRN